MCKYPSTTTRGTRMISHRYYEGLSYLIDDGENDQQPNSIDLFQQQPQQSRNDNEHHDQRSHDTNLESWGYFVDFTSPEQKERKTSSTSSSTASSPYRR
jgi:hypothetical protein